MKNCKYTIINSNDHNHTGEFIKVSKTEKASCIVFTLLSGGAPLGFNFIRNTCFSKGYYSCCGGKYNSTICKPYL
jgi:hypothetical protein